MTNSITKIKLRISNTEIEIECDIDNLNEIISKIPKIIESINTINDVKSNETLLKLNNNSIEKNGIIPPDININKSDSLTDVLLKLFASNWSNNPKKLSEVRETLQLYGLIYPKQTIAVTLLRMAKSGKLRRFKSNNGEYVYTASNSLISSIENNTKFGILTN